MADIYQDENVIRSDELTSSVEPFESVDPKKDQETVTTLTPEQVTAFIAMSLENAKIPASLDAMNKTEKKQLTASINRIKKATDKKEKAAKIEEQRNAQRAQNDNRPFKFLGYDSGIYYMISMGQLQVLALKAGELSQNNLLQLASLDWWRREYPTFDPETGKYGKNPEWQQAVDDIIQGCTTEGVYHPEAIKGRGFWRDGDISVRHLGNKLININSGEEIPLLSTELKGIYQKSKSMDIPNSEIATQEQINKFYQTIKAIYWTNKTSPMLLIGWAAIAPMCGLLNWRPHIWITGEHGSGKSDTVIEALSVAIGKTQMIHAKDSTTEAGMRQTLKSDAIPVLLDEMEPNSAKDRARIDRLISLARNASSDDEATTLKGSVSGDSVSYRVRSMFCYASINTHLPELADQSRTSVLSIEKRQQTEKSKEDFSLIKRNLAQLEKSDFGYSLTNYMIKHVDVLIENIGICIEAAGDILDSARDGKQYGTLIAGYITMIKGEVITREQALTYLEKIDLNKDVSDDRNTEETGWDAFWDKVVNIRLDFRDSKSRVSIGEGLEMMQQKDLSGLAKIVGLDNNGKDIEDDQTSLKIMADKGMKEVILSLKKVGIIYQSGEKSLYGNVGEGIYLANESVLLEKALSDTAFVSWKQYSKRVGEMVSKNIKMAGVKRRSKFIPVPYLNM
jgi:putative DNA primase/helicase